MPFTSISPRILKIPCVVSGKLLWLSFTTLNRAPSSPKAPYLFMGNCCANTHTVPSSSAPVLFQHGTEMSPVPSSQPPSQSRRQTASRPESTDRSGMSSQGSNPRIRTKSAPQPPQFSRSSSSRNSRTRVKSVTGLKTSNRSDSGPTVPGESDK
jgi:hypothetical protein